MMKSLYSGVAGLKVHNQRMDVIGNNISNVNTTAYKTSTVTFKDIYYQTKTVASSGSGTKGGVNPKQIGYGAALGTVNQVMSQSGFTYSDSVYDCALQGEGFFQVMDQSGNIYYSRNGLFTVDNVGNLVDPNGYIVLGVSGDPTGQAAASQRLNLYVPPVQNNQASATKTYKGYEVTFMASGYGEAGNISVTLQQSDVPFATQNGTNLNVQLDMTKDFATQQEFEDAVNFAIRAGGVNLGDDVVPLSIRFDSLPADTSAKTAKNAMEFLLPDGSKSYISFETMEPGAFGNAYEVNVKVSTSATEPLAKWADNVLTITLPGKTTTKMVPKMVREDDGSFVTIAGYEEAKTAADEAKTALDEATAAYEEEAKAVAAADPPRDTTNLAGLRTAMEDAEQAYATAVRALSEVSTTESELMYQSSTGTLISEINLAIMKAAGATPNTSPDPEKVLAYSNAINVLPNYEAAYASAAAAYIAAKTELDAIDANITPAEFATQSALVTRLSIERDVAYGELNRKRTDVNRLFNEAYYIGGTNTKFVKASVTNIDGETGAGAEPPATTPRFEDMLKSVGTSIKRVGLKDGDDNFYRQVAKDIGTVRMENGRLEKTQNTSDLDTVFIDSGGVIYGEHSVHGRLIMGRIDIVTFENPVGLSQVGTSYWKESLASGEARVKIAGTEGSAEIVSGALEMSNVDLSQEFSDMIITQRGFQANSRVITVSDTMLEELINLKR